MNKIKIVNELIKKDYSIDELHNELVKLFKDQIEINTRYRHLILTEEQYNSFGEDFNWGVFGNDMLISVKHIGKFEFVHYFDLENMNSIKEKGLLVSYSKKDDDFIPDMGYGISVISGNNGYCMHYDIIELFLERNCNHNAEVGFVVGVYTGEYLEAINTYHHSGHYLLLEDVTLDMIKEIDYNYISELSCNSEHFDWDDYRFENEVTFAELEGLFDISEL